MLNLMFLQIALEQCHKDAIIVMVIAVKAQFVLMPNNFD